MYTTVEAVMSVVARDIDQTQMTAASLTTGQIEDAINSAGREIDAKLSGQYRVPFKDWPDAPPLIEEICRDIAAFLADLTFRQDTDYTSENEPMLLRHRRAQELLEMLINGRIALTEVEQNPLPEKANSQATAYNQYEGNLFGLDTFGLGYGRGHGRWEYYPGTEW